MTTATTTTTPAQAPAHVPVDAASARSTPAPGDAPCGPPAGAAPAHDAVAALIARWRRDGTTFVVVDERGRHRDELAAGRLDLAHPSVVEARWVDATLHRTGYVLLDACNVPRRARPVMLSRALAAVRRLRERSGQPEWVVLEDAQDLLREPGLSPQALDLAHGGLCLAVRDGGSLPAWTATAGLEVRTTQPDLELTLRPPAHGVG
jgi:hypothetical protein